MESRTIRVFWPNAKTGWFNFNWNGPITANSVVHISASECEIPSGNIFGAEGVPRTRGAAAIGVRNVRPHGPNQGDNISGGVEFYLQIDWESPLHVSTDITVLGEPEQVQFR
jgi:hypothetical protein